MHPPRHDVVSRKHGHMGIQLERPAPLLCAAAALLQVRKVTYMNELGNMIFRRDEKEQTDLNTPSSFAPQE